MVESIVNALTAACRVLPNTQTRGKEFWILASFIIILPWVWKPFSPLAILSLFFLCLHQTILSTIDPGQLLRAKYLLENVDIQSQTLLPEMNVLYENARKALVDEYVRGTAFAQSDHDLKTN